MPKNLTVDFQDLEPLIIRGKNAMIEKKLRREGKTETKVKNTQGETNNKMRKIEDPPSSHHGPRGASALRRDPGHLCSPVVAQTLSCRQTLS
jgi:hypothetical protein